LYGELINNPHILPYSPKKYFEFENRFRLVQQLYDNPLAATKIFTANDENNILYAIKEIKKGKLKDTFAYQLARNELSVHYSLSKKSNFIANVPEYFENDNSFYMVMEYCNNPNYFQYRLENVYIPLPKKLKQFDNEAKLKHYALNILYGLADIHKSNVIHCDIKPDNFLLFTNDYELNTSSNEDDSENISLVDQDHLVKITDFGLAHIISQGNTRTYLKHPCGSFGYSAPEKKSVSKTLYILLR
jgi:serine/threonine protein kinase